jgi:hypothetical protein
MIEMNNFVTQHYMEIHKVPVHLCRDKHIIKVWQWSEYSTKSMDFDNGQGRPITRHFESNHEAINAMNHFLFGPEVVEGDSFLEFINQSYRECVVKKITPTRIRLEYELPQGYTGTWRHPFRLNDKVYYCPEVSEYLARCR